MLQKLKIIFVCLLLLLGPKGYSNSYILDSPSQVIESTSGEQQLQELFATIDQVMLKQPNQAIIFAQRALALAQKQDDSTNVMRARFIIAKAQYLIGQYNPSLDQLELVYNHYEKVSDSLGLVESLQLYGQIYTHIGDFKKALEFSQKAISMAENLGITKIVSDLNRETGNIYFYFGEHAIALDFFQKSLSICEKNSDKEGIAKAYNNMGRIYAELGRANTALEYLIKALESKERDEDRTSYGNTLLNIGTVYIGQKDYSKALKYLEDAQACFASVNNTEGTANTLYYRGQVYFIIKRYNQALALYNEAWKMATGINSKRLMVNISLATSTIYEEIGDYQRAHTYIQRYIALRDTVFSEEKSKLLIELETRYQLQAKQRQIELLSKERALEKSEKIRFLFFIGMLSAIAVFFITLTYINVSRSRYKSKVNKRLIREVAHRKRVETQLNEHQDQLETLVDKRTWELKMSKKKAEDADRLKTAFLANMSHEIRTPMNAIVGFSYLLTDKESTDEAKAEYIKIIKSNSEVLMNLINDILDISIIEAGQLKTKMKTFALNEFLDEIRFFFEQELEKSEKNDIAFKTDFDPMCRNIVLNTDKVRFKQILSNLLWNALKFTSSGYISFGYRFSGADELIFYVKDTGMGIEPEHHKLIFERFSKLNLGIDSALQSGTGLGLAICHELVSLLGGEIWLDSILGKGSTFYFTLPFQPNSDISIEPGLANFRVNKDLFKGKTALIAEDVPNNFKLVEAFLANLDIEIFWAKDGVEAIKICTENPSIDIILMDIQMPIMDGLNALRNIRKINPSVPVIVNTAFYMNDEMEKSFEAGCSDYMNKPIRKEDLLIKFTQYLA